MLHVPEEVVVGSIILKTKSKSCNVWKELWAFPVSSHQVIRKMSYKMGDLCGWIHSSQTSPDVELIARALKILTDFCSPLPRL